MYTRPETSFIFDFLSVALIIVVAVGLVLFLRVAYLILMDKDYTPLLGGYRAPPPPEPPEPPQRAHSHMNPPVNFAGSLLHLKKVLHENDFEPDMSLALEFNSPAERWAFLREMLLQIEVGALNPNSFFSTNVYGVNITLTVKDTNHEDR